MIERFHVLAGEVCNNNCVFCMEHDGAGRTFGEARATPDRVRAELEAHAAESEVMFASGEPTLNRDLPRYLQWARELGYRRIGLTTNARRLGYEAYCRRLLASGLNHVVVSLHGSNARSHVGQTRAPGSFEQTVAGLEMLSRLRREYPFSLHTSTVVGKRNVEALAEIHRLLSRFGPDEMVFNAMQPLGRASAAAKLLVARYEDVVRAFARLLDEAPPRGPRLYLVDVPLCATESLPSAARGWMEGAVFTSFEESGLATLRRTRVHKELANRAKRDACSACRYDPECLGVWRGYLEVHGWGGLEPVAPPPPAVAPRSP
jgi:MoaA/NifB/PqqE/SkfB family radical SAM enzyme